MEEEEKEERSIANTSVINHDCDLWEDKAYLIIGGGGGRGGRRGGSLFSLPLRGSTPLLLRLYTIIIVNVLGVSGLSSYLMPIMR